MDFFQFAEFAASGKINGTLKVLRTAPLHPSLKHCAMLFCCSGKLSAEVESNRTWFFRIDIFSGLSGVDGHVGMPVIAGGNENGIDVGAVKQVPKIAIQIAGLSFKVFGKPVLGGVSPFGLDIAEGKELHVALPEHLQEIASAAFADSDDSESDGVVRSGFAFFAESSGGKDKRSRSNSGGFQ